VSIAPFNPINIPKMKILKIEVANPTPEIYYVFPKCPTAIISTVSTRNAHRDDKIAGTLS